MVPIYRFSGLYQYIYVYDFTWKRRTETIPPSPDIVPDKKMKKKERKWLNVSHTKYTLTIDKTLTSKKPITYVILSYIEMDK